jgi:hypothetical protein
MSALAAALLAVSPASASQPARGDPGFGGPLQFLTKAIPKPVTPRRPGLGWQDHTLRGLSSALIGLDWLTTVDGLRRGMPESNPLLGRHPSLGKANVLIGAGMLANALLVPKIKDPELRRGVWAAVSFLELDALRANRSAGLRLNFRF